MDGVEKAISDLFDAIEAAEDAWSVCKFGEARDAERDGAQRVTVLLKLHQRYSAVRKSRERRELMA
jgi:hypothetical protein